MAIKLADRVFETSTTQGTGTLNLAGAPTGFQTFVSGVGDGEDAPYFISDGTDWEAGIGTVTSGSPDTLSRDTILESSNSDAAVNWGAGTRNVILYPGAELTPTLRSDNIFTAKTAFLDAGELTISSGAVTITGTNHTIDTESDAASDDLDTINGTSTGGILLLQIENASRAVALKHGTGNIKTSDANDIILSNVNDCVLLHYSVAQSAWLVVASYGSTKRDVISPVSLYPSGFVSGLVPSNGTDSDHDIDYTAGYVVSNDSTTGFSVSAMTKEFDSSWAAGDGNGGLFDGSLANTTQYNVYAIYNPTTEIADIGADTLANGVSNLPSGYTKYKLIHSFFTDGSANILGFVSYESGAGQLLTMLKDPVLNHSGNLTTTQALITLSVPLGRRVVAKCHIKVDTSGGGYAYIRPTDVDNEAASGTAAPLCTIGTDSAQGDGANPFEALTDTNGQVYGRSNLTLTAYIATLGYVESRV